LIVENFGSFEFGTFNNLKILKVTKFGSYIF
jgi:hypothetical protein